MDNNPLRTASNAEAVLSFLRDRGVLENESITPQQVKEKKQKQAYHNTLLLLTNYRSILWQTESELETVAAELNLPLQKLDAVLSRIDAEIGMENRRLELRLERLAKTRLLLDRINDALTALKYKPGNGQLLYDLIYMTYIAEEKMLQSDVLFRLNISRRHYYRLKEQAISLLSLRLWSAPSSDLDLWLELVSMLS
ncbi:MAG: hypothetical protein II885_04655 [Oscillospiraceae bacterium]|nr:hypothetical protein [Oscillospiraceae bacterium]